MLAPKEYIPFKSLFNLQERKYKYTKAMNSQENPNVVLIILEPHPRAKVKGLHNCRFAVESHQSLNYLREQIHKKLLKLNSSECLFLYTKKVMLVGEMSMMSLHERYKDDDGFLYINYAEMDVY